MSDQQLEEGLNFDMPKNRSSVIKVMGVGGGGSNAVNHMKRLGIKGVDFIICNTDSQALEHSPVETKIQLGVNLTEGLGAGANPDIGEKAALETAEDIRSVLENNTKMLFITAGMGGGTGTGAAPIIARVAQEMGILTVGIVTIPFAFEGKTRLKQAELGIDKFKAHLDSLIVINNNKLREVYGNLGFKAGFAKADEVLATAAKGIAEVITHHYTTNIDLKDAKTVLSDSGTAIMGSAQAEGANRAVEAIRNALDSPLLNDNHIVGAKNVLLLIISGSDENEITFDEIGEINDYIQNEAGGNANIIMGIGEDSELNNAVSVTIIATGFEPSSNVQHFTRAPERVVHTLDDNESSAFENPLEEKSTQPKVIEPDVPARKSAVQRNLFDEDESPEQTEQPLSEAGRKPEVIESPETVDEQDSVESRHGVADEYTDEEDSPTDPEQEERVVYELDESETDTDEDFVLEDETDEADKVLNRQDTEVDSEAADESTSFDFSIEDVFSGTDEDEAEQDDAVADTSDNPEAIDEPLAGPAESEERSNEVHLSLDHDHYDSSTEYREADSGEEQDNGVIRHSLEDLLELEERLGMGRSTPRTPEPDDSEDESLKFEVHQAEEPAAETETADDSDPMDRPVNESMKRRAAERRERLEAFNFRFKNLQSNLLESEREPAFKRQGVDIDPTPHSSRSKFGGSSIGGDGDDLEMRSNNSFLHDNVD